MQNTAEWRLNWSFYETSMRLPEYFANCMPLVLARYMPSLRTRESHALAHTYEVLRAPFNERERRCSPAPKARAEKNWELHVNLSQKCLFAQPVWAKSARNKTSSESRNTTTKCRAPLPMQMEKRIRCSRVPKARAEKIRRFCFIFNKKSEETLPLVYAKSSFLKTHQNHALTNA